ncbi:MAG: DMT family transporter, partial [Coriobacteriia bacterium]|nr:DMT family transporter [Coriobacteriia bacterium]
GMAAASIFGYGAASLCFFFALQHASASVVAVLLYAYPAMVAALHAFTTRTRPGVRVMAGVLVTFVGCIAVVGVLEQKAQVDAAGILLGLGAAVAYATFTVLSDRLVEGRSRLVVMTYMFGISAIGMAIVAVLAGESLSVAGWQTTLWVFLALIVAVPTVMAVVLYLEGIRQLGPSRAALASTIEPVFTIGLAAWLLGERLTPLQLGGAVLVVAGIALSQSTGGSAADVPPLASNPSSTTRAPRPISPASITSAWPPNAHAKPVRRTVAGAPAPRRPRSVRIVDNARDATLKMGVRPTAYGMRPAR